MQPWCSNNALEHLGEPSSELKITVVPEKSFWTKELNSSSQSGGRGYNCFHSNFSRDHFRRSTYSNELNLTVLLKRRLGLNILSAPSPHNTVQWTGAPLIDTQLSISVLRRGRDPEKAPV
jgi:hypothetical protein